MVGMDAATGKRLSGLAHVRQSVRDILTTPIGTRVMRRSYGSRLFELIDAPINRETLLLIYRATADALATWEPRVRVKQVLAESASPGHLVISLVADYLPDGREITLDGLVVA